jgi:hypothetical protein
MTGATSDPHLYAGGEAAVELRFRCQRQVVARLHAGAAELGVTLAEYLRLIVGRETEGRSDDERFTRHLLRWWASGGQGNPVLMEGAVVRAESAGIAFPTKLRNALRVMLDHGLI